MRYMMAMASIHGGVYESYIHTLAISSGSLLLNLKISSGGFQLQSG
jgi:hypothetical protein